MGLDQQCGCCWQISLLNGPTSLENQEQDVLNKVIILPPSCAGREDERGKWKLALGGLQSRDRQTTEPVNYQAADAVNLHTSGSQLEGALQSLASLHGAGAENAARSTPTLN